MKKLRNRDGTVKSGNREENEIKFASSDVKSSSLRRRRFLKTVGLSTLTAAFGVNLTFSNTFSEGTISGILEDKANPLKLYGKHSGLTLLNDRPVNAETPPHLLNDNVTPADKFFMRNNGLIPEGINSEDWKIEFSGESVEKPITLSLSDLKNKFKSYTYNLTIECGGNGRSEYYPPAKGNQWTLGAVACSKWTGARLRDVLDYVGIKEDAVYVAYYGADKHLSGDEKKVVISRGIPMKKAMENETLLAYKMNDEDIPLAHGFPVRLVAGGWPGSVCGKWVKSIVVRNIVHDGPKMTGMSYRVPCKPVAPGSEVAPEEMCIIESMPVKSLITYPKTGAIIELKDKLKINGHAWAGDDSVSKMEYSTDFGSTWSDCSLKSPVNRLAWQKWEAEIKFAEKGYFEIWAKATDSKGRSQPLVVPGWNPKGYLNNACHRIAVKVV